MRAFLTHSIWNGSNKSFIAGYAPTFAHDESGTNFGYQFEAWF
ncbi:MAG: carbohydrate porin [Bdellovibrio sp.]